MSTTGYVVSALGSWLVLSTVVAFPIARAIREVPAPPPLYPPLVLVPDLSDELLSMGGGR